jgi:hypothetical protein
MSVFLSIDQVKLSLPLLARLNPFFGTAFLAFKKEGIPVGSARTLVFSRIAQGILEKHYRPAAAYAGFYNPLKTSDPSNRWTSPRYGSTSLQRITTDTFGDALIHKKKESSWGWRNDYIVKLRRHLNRHLIPSFHLGVWLFRDSEWPASVSPGDVLKKLSSEYNLTAQEIEALFDENVSEIAPSWVTGKPISEGDLLAVIGNPPGWGPPPGAALRSLQIREVGPARTLRYEPAERLNVITGDNSLGKTFLLECLWWALTGEWLEFAAAPREGVAKHQPKIRFSLTSATGKVQDFSASFNWTRQTWVVSPPAPRSPGLVIYARYDGSFAIWDPARAQLEEQHSRAKAPGRIFLTRSQVWDGSQDKAVGTGQTWERWVCNGLLRDWLSWQTGGERFKDHYSAFVSSLTALSPSESEQLQPGEPGRLLPDSRWIPTLQMPYGKVLILHASAAVQRIVALAYVLVWAWHEHLAGSSIMRREPQRHLVLIVDEVEAHLHPLWQRLIVPSIMKVAAELSSMVKPQLHIATHSPLVLASMEAVFDGDRDGLHHLKLVEGHVALEELPFVRRGRADLWLVSEVFGLGQARSLPAERAIDEAKGLQLSATVPPEKVRDVNSRLVSLLAPDDEFWPRWRYFAQQHGVGK